MSTTMKDKAVHTPGPWAYDGKHIVSTINYAPSHPYLIAAVLKHRPGSADRVPFGTDDAGDNEANAAFIVRACNSHDDMLAALERAVSANDSGDSVAEMTEALADMRAAIAKARGEV